eukprot:117313-Karenia_brevis.AAC.1
MCTCVSNGTYSVQLPKFPVDIFVHMPSLQWAFVAFLDDESKLQYHPIFHGAHADDHLHLKEWKAIPADVIGRPIDQQVLPQPDVGSVGVWNVLSHNVRNLSDVKVCSALVAQYEADRIHIAGLQEVRSCKAGVFLRDNYVVAASAKSKHDGFGCRIMFSTVHKFGVYDGKPIFVDCDNVVIIHSAPRLLVAVLTLKVCRVVCVSLHAPHANCDRHAEWWKDATTT